MAGLLALGAMIAPHASAQIYHLSDLGVSLGRTLSRPAAINNTAQVAGSSEASAFRYSNGVMQQLGTLPGGTTSTGLAINNLGQVAGASTFMNGGNIRHATLFHDGTATDLGSLPSAGNYSFGAGINDSTEVVGYAGANSSTTNTRAFIWDANRGMRDLGTLGGQYLPARESRDQ